MTKSTKKTITSSRVIAALFRESLFSPSSFALTIFVPILIRHNLHLLELFETSSREQAETRRLKFRISGNHESLEPSLEGKLEIGIGRYLAEGEVKVLQEEGESIITTLPDKLIITDYRKSNRQRIDHAIDMLTPVALVSGEEYSEGALQIEDVSSDGYGALLTAPSGFSVTKRARIIGQVILSEGTQNICASIVRAQLLEEASTGDTCLYRVGLHQAIRAGRLTETKPYERRTQPRYSLNESVVIHPIIRQKHQHKVLITSASLDGFRAVLEDKKRQINLPVGSQFTLEETSINLELVNFDENVFSFNFISGNEKDRLAWLKRISHFSHADIDLSTQDSREVLNIFCQAGALSTSFLKSHRQFAKKLLSDLETDSVRTPWLHRWVCHDPKGAPIGHASVIKFSDNSWLIGDIAGSQDPENKIPKTFISQFIRTFRDFSNTLEPCPRHIIMWVNGHPYWKPLEHYIQGEGIRHVLAKFELGYMRLPFADRYKTDGSVVIQHIKPTDFKRITEIRHQLSQANLLDVASAFDFDIDRFGSPITAETIRSSGRRFFRKYFFCIVGGMQWLLIISDYPLGTSLNRVPESAWLFPLSEMYPDMESWKKFIHQIQLKGLELGIKIPSVRRVITSASDTSFFDQLEQARLRCLICHPDIWSFYDQDHNIRMPEARQE